MLIQAVQDWPEPSSVKIVQEVLGLIIYYWKFVKCYAKIAVPISDLERRHALQ